MVLTLRVSATKKTLSVLSLTSGLIAFVPIFWDIIHRWLEESNRPRACWKSIPHNTTFIDGDYIVSITNVTIIVLWLWHLSVLKGCQTISHMVKNDFLMISPQCCRCLNGLPHVSIDKKHHLNYQNLNFASWHVKGRDRLLNISIEIKDTGQTIIAARHFFGYCSSGQQIWRTKIKKLKN